MVIDQATFLYLEDLLVRKYKNSSMDSNPILYNTLDIEIQLLSQEDIKRGVNATFPMAERNTLVQSEVPNPTISMNSYLMCLA